MMPVHSLIFKWYVFITLLALLGSTTLEPQSVIAGLLFMWLLYAIFLGGFYSFSDSSLKVQNEQIIFSDKFDCFFKYIAISNIFCSLYAASFYTGKGPVEIFVGLSLGESLYNSYQKYFAENSLGVFSIAKFPAIFSMFFMKLSLVYLFFITVVYSSKIKAKSMFYLLIVCVSSLYFSVARGTSFELFEILLLLWFCLTIRAIKNVNKTGVFSTQNIVLVSFALLSLGLYSYNISARYSFKTVTECVTNEICLSSDTLLFYISEPLAVLTLKMSGYFTFGVFYVSAFIESVWFSAPIDFLSWLFPSMIINGENVEFDFLCDSIIDCRAAWVPDSAIFITKYGVVVVSILCYLVGFLCRCLSNSTIGFNDVFRLSIVYLMFLGMASLPVGNFLSTSSANVMLLFFSILMFAITRFLNLLKGR